MNSQTFGEKIREARLQLGISLKSLSKKIACNSVSLSKIERSLKKAPVEIIEPLAKELKINYKELMLLFISENIFHEVKNLTYAAESLDLVKKRLLRNKKGTSKFKKKEQIFEEIKHYAKQKPIEKVWIFGSFARNQSSLDSDLDLLVRFTKPNKITLFDLIDMKNELHFKIGRDIDLIEEGQLLNGFENEINKEKILIYDKEAQ